MRANDEEKERKNWKQSHNFTRSYWTVFSHLFISRDLIQKVNIKINNSSISLGIASAKAGRNSDIDGTVEIKISTESRRWDVLISFAVVFLGRSFNIHLFGGVDTEC